MEKRFSTAFGLLLTLLTCSGFAQHRLPKHFLGLMNVDTPHSILRVPLTAALLYAGSDQATLKTTRTILSGIGGIYMTIGAIGSIDRKLGGMLPSKLTNFDLIYHFTMGATALWLGARSGRMMK